MNIERRPMNYRDAESRYHNDMVFHALVDSMMYFAFQMKASPGEWKLVNKDGKAPEVGDATYINWNNDNDA